MDAKTVLDQFLGYYYPTFAQNRANLGPLYRDASLLSWEGTQYQGPAKIVEKLASLPFQSVAHRLVTQDFQPLDGALLITVTGQILIDGENNPQFFTQTFVLKPEGGSFFISNDVFRLVLG